MTSGWLTNARCRSVSSSSSGIGAAPLAGRVGFIRSSQVVLYVPDRVVEAGSDDSVVSHGRHQVFPGDLRVTDFRLLLELQLQVHAVKRRNRVGDDQVADPRLETAVLHGV